MWRGTELENKLQKAHHNQKTLSPFSMQHPCLIVFMLSEDQFQFTVNNKVCVHISFENSNIKCSFMLKSMTGRPSALLVEWRQ